jgi:dTDP-glucose 4,6-dehydratase
MRVLVTGGLGFIGSNFIEHVLQNREWSILNVDRCDYCARVHNVENHPRYTLVQADITNMSKMKKLFQEFRPEVVVHFAAQSHVDRSFENTWDYIHDNIIGTYTLLECLKDMPETLLVHVSTDEVYGEVELDEVSTVEKSVLNPTNPYSATKASAELLVKAYGHSFGTKWIMTRGNNVFGPKQYPEKVIPKFITQILAEKPCTIHGDGRSRRNFIYIDDVSRALLAVIEKGSLRTVYNIGTRNEYSVVQIFNILRNIMNEHAECVHVSDRPHNDKRYAVDSSALQALGWSEEASFIDVLRKTIEWYKDHPTWYA